MTPSTEVPPKAQLPRLIALGYQSGWLSKKAVEPVVKIQRPPNHTLKPKTLAQQWEEAKAHEKATAEARKMLGV